MAIVYNDNIQLNAPKSLDNRYLSSGLTPYANTAAVNSAILSAYRYRGLTVLINNVEYWYRDGVTNGDLIVKTSGVAAANNGLSVSGSTVVLGQDVGQVGNPGELLADREIPADGTGLSLINPSTSTKFSFTSDSLFFNNPTPDDTMNMNATGLSYVRTTPFPKTTYLIPGSFVMNDSENGHSVSFTTDINPSISIQKTNDVVGNYPYLSLVCNDVGSPITGHLAMINDGVITIGEQTNPIISQLAYFDIINARVGINVVPTQDLDIQGQVRIRGGSPGANKIFISNATGVGSWATLRLTNSATLDFPSTPGGDNSDLTITVTGATDGDPVALGIPSACVLNESLYFAWVSSADTVTVRFMNLALSPQDPPSGMFRVSVSKF